MTSSGALLFHILTLILTFHKLNGDGHIDLTIEQLTFRTVPPGCDRQISASSTSVPYNSGFCTLNFRLCVGAVDHLSSVDTFPAGRFCNVLSANFAVVVHGVRPFDAADRTFAVDAPSGVVHQRRFDFTSAITPNVSVQLEIRSNFHKLLLATGFLSPLPTHDSQIAAPAFRYVNYGNIFTYRLKAICSAGFVGPKCTETCEPPKPGDHYFCAVDGMRCMPGWGGTRCLQPQWPQRCANGGRCLQPGHQCPPGWTGDQCDQCVPSYGCKNGHCLEDRPATCTCFPNWTGANCDRLVNKCLHKPCKNGAQCTPVGVNGDFVRCICPPGFTGRDCGIPFANCKNAICPGQNQQCVPLEHGYTCACAPGFGGPNCGLSHQQQQRRRQQQKQQQQIGHDDGAPMAPQDFHGLVTIGTCVVLFLLFAVCMQKRRNRRHKTVEENGRNTPISIRRNCPTNQVVHVHTICFRQPHQASAGAFLASDQSIMNAETRM